MQNKITVYKSEERIDRYNFQNGISWFGKYQNSELIQCWYESKLWNGNRFYYVSNSVMRAIQNNFWSDVDIVSIFESLVVHEPDPLFHEFDNLVSLSPSINGLFYTADSKYPINPFLTADLYTFNDSVCDLTDVAQHLSNLLMTKKLLYLECETKKIPFYQDYEADCYLSFILKLNQNLFNEIWDNSKGEKYRSSYVFDVTAPVNDDNDPLDLRQFMKG